jgi:hypothetical protein
MSPTVDAEVDKRHGKQVDGGAKDEIFDLSGVVVHHGGL